MERPQTFEESGQPSRLEKVVNGVVRVLDAAFAPVHHLAGDHMSNHGYGTTEHPLGPEPNPQKVKFEGNEQWVESGRLNDR